MYKKYIYIISFTVLGILVSFILHAAIEIPLLKLFQKDFIKYGFGLSWDIWYAIHSIGTIILFIAGAILGIWGGVHWWRVIYVEKKFRKKKST